MTDNDSIRGDLEIIVGTYEDYVVGYQVERFPIKSANGVQNSSGKKAKIRHPTRKEERLDLEQSFAVRGHSGSVRCLTASANGNLVFSAGQDEMINLFNLKRRKLLQTSEGAVSCATFVENSHLICGSDDSNIYVYEIKGSSMILAKTLKGHKESVTSLDTHPSGKILLSISKDHTMRTWNLIKGRSAYVTQIKPDSHIVKWSQSGEEFLIAANNEIYLYNSSGNLKHCVKLEKRVNSIEFITSDIFAVAIDSGKLEFFNLSLDGCPSIIRMEAHETRIKSIKCLSSPDVDVTDGDVVGENQVSKKASMAEIRFATAASDGKIKIWSIIRSPDTLKDPKELTMVDIGARITCMIASKRPVQ